MPFVVVKPDGTEAEHNCYAPAEHEAKQLAYAQVLYVGIRGMAVRVWPLDALPVTT